MNLNHNSGTAASPISFSCNVGFLPHSPQWMSVPLDLITTKIQRNHMPLFSCLYLLVVALVPITIIGGPCFVLRPKGKSIKFLVVFPQTMSLDSLHFRVTAETLASSPNFGWLNTVSDFMLLFPKIASQSSLAFWSFPRKCPNNGSLEELKTCLETGVMLPRSSRSSNPCWGLSS